MTNKDLSDNSDKTEPDSTVEFEKTCKKIAKRAFLFSATDEGEIKLRININDQTPKNAK